MKTYHPDLLVSPGAGERYKKWRSELEKAGPHGEDEDLDVAHPLAAENSIMTGQPDAHNLGEAACWNESQSFSPTLKSADPSPLGDYGDSTRSSSDSRKRRNISSNDFNTDGQGSDDCTSGDSESDKATGISWLSPIDRKIGPIRPDVLDRMSVASSNTDWYMDQKNERSSTSVGRTPLADSARNSQASMDPDVDQRKLSRDDNITDTVGAIAVDCFGNIAAGSSSGGIGMKHKGRVGPAALVGIGTAVVPTEPGDVSRLSVASVTSGTGEHMATSMAAATCANRLYTSTRRGERGSSEETDDDTAIKSFVEQDFMGKAHALCTTPQFK